MIRCFPFASTFAVCAWAVERVRLSANAWPAADAESGTCPTFGNLTARPHRGPQPPTSSPTQPPTPSPTLPSLPPTAAPVASSVLISGMYDDGVRHVPVPRRPFFQAIRLSNPTDEPVLLRSLQLRVHFDPSDAANGAPSEPGLVHLADTVAARQGGGQGVIRPNGSIVLCWRSYSVRDNAVCFPGPGVCDYGVGAYITADESTFATFEHIRISDHLELLHDESVVDTIGNAEDSSHTDINICGQYLPNGPFFLARRPWVATGQPAWRAGRTLDDDECEWTLREANPLSEQYASPCFNANSIRGRSIATTFNRSITSAAPGPAGTWPRCTDDVTCVPSRITMGRGQRRVSNGDAVVPQAADRPDHQGGLTDHDTNQACSEGVHKPFAHRLQVRKMRWWVPRNRNRWCSPARPSRGPPCQRRRGRRRAAPAPTLPPTHATYVHATPTSDATPYSTTRPDNTDASTGTDNNTATSRQQPPTRATAELPAVPDNPTARNGGGSAGTRGLTNHIFFEVCLCVCWA